MRYRTKVQTVQAVQWDGTDQAEEDIRGLCRDAGMRLPSHRFAGFMEWDGWGRADHPRSFRRVRMFRNHWLVLDQESVLSVYTDGDFRKVWEPEHEHAEATA